MEILLKLFLTFLKIGLVSIGGGYAVIPSIHEEAMANATFVFRFVPKKKNWQKL